VAKFLVIRNWGKYQHYKDRNPPWIKLHVELMTSMDWVSASDKSRVLMMGLMMLAAKCDNKIPLNKGYIKRVCYLNSEPDFRELLELQFIEQIEDRADASTLPQNASDSYEMLDQRKSTEKETEAETPRAAEHEQHFQVEMIRKAHPRGSEDCADGRKAIRKAIDREAKNFPSKVEAARFLYKRALTYKQAVSEWPPGDKRFVKMCATWFNKESYRNSDESYRRSEIANSKSAQRSTGNKSAILEGLGLVLVPDGRDTQQGDYEGIDGGVQSDPEILPPG
jgi:hypothetical protein